VKASAVHESGVSSGLAVSGFEKHLLSPKSLVKKITSDCCFSFLGFVFDMAIIFCGYNMPRIVFVGVQEGCERWRCYAGACSLDH
jgi:hypothetical protein